MFNAQNAHIKNDTKYGEKKSFVSQSIYRETLEQVLATNLLPDGIDYLADMDVRNCVKILSKRMDTQFIQKFTNKGKDVNIAA